MTKKDYVLISGCIKKQREEGNPERNKGLDSVSRSLAAELADDNPRFDCARFLKACGL
jgi:hypothetical protein